VNESAYVPDPRENTSYAELPGGDLGGGSGGSGDVQVFEGRAPAAPDNTAIAAISFDTGGGPQQEWAPSLQAWV
jgi:hypothetical protein